MPEDNPLNEDNIDDVTKELEDLLAQQLFGHTKISEALDFEAYIIRFRLKEFESLAGNLKAVRDNIQNDKLTDQQRRSLDLLTEDPQFKEAFVNRYANAFYSKTGANEAQAETEGYQLASVLTLYSEYIKSKNSNTSILTVEDQIQAQIDQMGKKNNNGFKSYLEFLDTNRRVKERLGLDTSKGKWRRDSPPTEIANWQCRIGASTFYVPPTSISVIQNHKTSSLAGAAIRQPNSPKINLGHSETTIIMTIYFPTHETIWGFEGDQPDWQFHNWDPLSNVPQETGYYGRGDTGAIVSDQVIDNYLSSLRGLITQFKYMPFLPVQNAYLNRVHDIDAVVMKNMTVSTVENYPFVAAVTLEMGKFNYNPYLPMIDHFDQAIHWGKFRQMAGRCAATLQSRVNKAFLVDHVWRNNGQQGVLTKEVRYEGEYTPTLDKGREISDGRHFDIYFPISTPSRIFAADTTDFRQPGEDEFFTREYWDFIIGDLGFVAVEAPDFNFFEYDNKRKFQTNEREILRTWLGYNVDIWEQMNSDKLQEFINEQIVAGQKNGSLNPSNVDAFEARLKSEWFYVLFDQILTNDPVFQKIKRSRESGETDYIIREWEVPMAKVDIDWSSCIVTGVGVSLSNKFASLQLQLQDEPTFQHIGGGDSTLDVEMTVLGEENIIALRRVFQHINGLARLERAHGVLGFLGIKNVFTALCGIKYVLPISFEVDTEPNYPNVYKLRLSFVDFDVMQQQREKLDSSQQTELVELFGKANPFLRIKQAWGQVNCYPDFPLDVRDDDNAVIGHLDPDWYFRSFRKDNTDLVEWSVDQKVVTLIDRYSSLSDYSTGVVRNGIEIQEEMEEIRQELRQLAQEKISLPGGWEFDGDGNLNSLEDEDLYDPEKREYRYYLGAYGEDQKKVAIMDMFNGGTFLIGEKDADSEKVEYFTGYSMFSEDLASKNLQGFPHHESTTALPGYQQEYLDGKANPNFQYQMAMKDWDYRSINGRMIKAFPTYMLWLIDEGGRFAGIKLFDNLYNLNSIIDFSVSQSADDPISDTLVMRLSNIYQKLTRPYAAGVFSEDDPLREEPVGQAIETLYNRQKNLESGLFDNIVDIDNIRLKPGVRVHLRAGWGNNPNALQTIFNGTITEVQAGEVMTVIAQSDAVELSAFVNSQNKKDHSGKLDGALNNFWLSEPRDLMVRLLSMGSSNFREWLAWGSKGVIFSDSRFGIRHFGSILYPPMTDSEVQGTYNLQSNAASSLNDQSVSNSSLQLNGLLGSAAGQLSEVTSITDFMPTQALSGTLTAMARALWTNSFARRDYEVFKRNIYPGNGTGIAQYMGGDLLDAGIIVSQAGTVYDEDQSSSADPLINPGDSPDKSSNTAPNDISEIDSEYNQGIIQDFWREYFKEEGIPEDEFQTLLQSSEISTVDIDINTSSPGILDYLFGFGKELVNVGNIANDLFSADVFGGFSLNAGLGPLAISQNILQTGTGVVNGLIRFGGSGIGQALGLSQIIRDDDIAGFDEVSFRAQTYMKSVWDLFQVCAALLPNYIVAVRPFEEGSTVFYGKPHWLYTSGVIPVTTGVQTEFSGTRPKIVDPDEVISGVLNSVNNTNFEVERMMTTARQTGALKDVEAFLLKNYDPYSVTAVAGTVELISDDSINSSFEEAIENVQESERNLDIVNGFKSIDYSTLTEGELTDLGWFVDELTKESFGDKNEPARYRWIYDDVTNINDTVRDAALDFAEVYFEEDSAPQAAFERLMAAWLAGKDEARAKGSAPNKIHDLDKLVKQIEEDKDLSDKQAADLKNLLNTDPITFAYQFGWRYSRAPIYIGTEANYGYDTFGELARQRYDEEHSSSVDVIGGQEGRSIDDARDVWYDFRRVYEYRPEVQEVYKRAFPFDETGENYEAVLDTFIRFLWQDPYNRAWVVLRASRSADGISDTLGGPGAMNEDGYYNKTQRFDGSSIRIEDNGTKTWFFDGIDGAWERFLISKDVTFDSNNVPVSGATKAWMRSNAQQGNSAGNLVESAVESVNDWFDENIGQVIGLVVDSVTGLIASLRLSLAQLSQGLQQSAEFQRQANTLNAVLMDSIYYQMGGDDEPLLRLVDNPYTRQYNEPVVEIREPFQRVHMVSSTSDILSNQIRENLNGVATVVTCVSDGKNPVTVHLDKGIPPDRQIETVVESGIYWDNAIGTGFFGFLQPLINPLESIRGFKKSVEGTSDQLSARRIGLYHLRNSVKNIYEGEIILLGNTDIRPHDLLYISDNYERIFGMVEVGQVIHHFTPETGFITSVTPNALVTVNDPGRWTMLSYLSNKFMNNAVRDEMRALMGIGVDRFVASGLPHVYSQDLENQFSDYISGAVQWTQGSTALVRDLGAIFAGGGIQGLTQRDEQAKKIIQLDIGIGALKSVSTIAGGAAGALLGAATTAGPGAVPLGAIGAGAGYAIGDLAWEAWQWVKDNLLDQHGLYIQFLNKEGQPMDAGLSYFQGSAVGSNHSLSLFPAIFGIPILSPRIETLENGHFRITTNDLLANLGWSEVETMALYRDTSLFVNMKNKEVLDIAGRGPDGGVIDNDAYEVFIARIFGLQEQFGDKKVDGVVDGDTINVVVIDAGSSGHASGKELRIRVAAINTAELPYKNNPYTDFNETLLNDPNDLGKLAYNYLANKYNTTSGSNIVAIRVRKSDRVDRYGRTIGTIFHNVPLSTAPSSRSKVLKQYAESNPPIPMQAYLQDGRPYTLNWELVMAGYGNVDMRESLWETDWRSEALD